MYDIIIQNNIRPAELGLKELFTIVLVLIVYILLNFAYDYLKNIRSSNEGVIAMNTKIKTIFATVISAILNFAMNISANLGTEVLLT